MGYLDPHLVLTGFWVTPVVGFVQPGFALQLDHREVESTFEVPLLHILDPANHQSRERMLGTTKVLVYDIPYGEHRIWGATAGMLIALYRLLNQRRVAGICERPPCLQSRVCWTSWRGCAIASAAVRGISNRASRRSLRTRSKKPTKSLMRSSAKTTRRLRDELGDLLFQVVFHSQMAREQGSFAFDDVVAAICDKMERRHPHVFGPQLSGTGRIDSAAAQTVAWEEQKRQEREQSGASVLADVPLALPALTRANKLGKRAAQVGFEWPDVAGALDKLDEELGELRQGLGEQASQAAHRR